MRKAKYSNFDTRSWTIMGPINCSGNYETVNVMQADWKMRKMKHYEDDQTSPIRVEENYARSQWSDIR